MSVIAIVGAGPGLGAAVAHRFGSAGFAVALIARNVQKLEALEQRLASSGLTAKGYIADVRDRDALATALENAAEDLGPIEVLQFSPVPSKEFLKPVLDTTVEDLHAAAELSILGSATSIRQVLPGMIERGVGTILLINGSSAATPNSNVAGTSTAFAGESAYGEMLHDAVAEKGVNVRQLIIPGAIGGGDPLYDLAALAERIWQLHAETEGTFRVTVGGEVA
ncbi:dehydrogenase [Tessaracoccus aquimaris]|uniref:Dehydrogenase n=1 Tax=Tessaracoccus aquimaris TaxID=1332264 RepID=A0A1Q2CK43_9ACTN|nr:SDR family NAD(P)-dependent oxidoreductase [Tessaracoccus aquimaris]AQP46453.1 dehydrogenase [Tessaracoccus aquimaris]